MSYLVKTVFVSIRDINGDRIDNTKNDITLSEAGLVSIQRGKSGSDSTTTPPLETLQHLFLSMYREGRDAGSIF